MTRDVREVIREEPLVRDRLLATLRASGPLTVSELAAATGFPPAEVMLWVTSMRKFGHAVTVENPEGDPRYAAEAAR